jgi:16S rRNA (adenine1518-N6/adenine1519-N6)-dimethyltransferase
MGADIAGLLRSHALGLKTDWGQHFLTDPTVIRDLLKAGDVQPGDHILEIGAGIGVLTKALLQIGARVTAIEVDKRWAPLMEEYLAEIPSPPQGGQGTGGGIPGLRLILGNALKVPFPDGPYKIVANIPYLISGKLLRTTLLHRNRPRSITILVQREVAEKVCDPEKGGMLSILVKLFGDPRVVRRVPPGAFLPPPKVESAILHIDCLPTPRADAKTADRVLELASHAFSKKRKMLRASLGKFHGAVERLSALGIAPERRPETLSIEEWIAVAKAWGKDEH